MEDITQTGNKTWKQIREEIEKGYTGDPSKINRFENFKVGRTRPRVSEEFYEGPMQSPIYQASGGTDYLGNSIWDKDTYSDYELAQLQQNPNELRAQNEWIIAKWGAGLGKAVGLAATTFLDGTVGLVYGLSSVITDWNQNDDWSKLNPLWENELSKELRQANEELENILPNYRTQEEIERPWYHNLGTANFWADSILKNAGFTVGAYFSGAAWTKALKAVSLLKSGMAAQVIGSFISGVNEARIEAGNYEDEALKSAEGMFLAQKEQGKQQDMEKIVAKYAEQLAEIQNRSDEMIATQGFDGKITYTSKNYLDTQRLKQQMEQEVAANSAMWEQRYNDAKDSYLDEIRRNARFVFGANTVLLTATNGWEFGKLYAQGFTPLKQNIKKVVNEVTGEVTYEAVTRNAAQKLGKGVSNMIAEGPIEEMGQKFISETAGYWGVPDDPDSYYQTLIDPEAQGKTRGFLEAAVEGLKHSYGSLDAWEEGFAGFIIGGMGTMTAGRTNNSGPMTVLGKGKLFGWSGGLAGEWMNATAEDAQAQEAANIMNSYLQKINDTAGSFAQSRHFTDEMDGYVAADDKYNYNSARDNSDFAAFTAFARMGRMDDLKEILDQNYESMSDEELQKIVDTVSGKKTTSEGTVITQNEDGTPIREGFRRADGSLMDMTNPQEKKEVLDALNKNKDRLLKGLEAYDNAVKEVYSISSGNLSNDEMAELAWLRWKGNMFEERYGDLNKLTKLFQNDLNSKLKEYVSDAREKSNELEGSIESLKGLSAEEAKEARKRNRKRKQDISSKTSIDIRTEEGKTLLSNLESLSEFLDLLRTAKTPLEASAEIASRPNMVKWMSMDDRVWGIISDLSGLDEQSFNESMRDIKDMAKIAKAARDFNQRFKEFKDNPMAMIENRKKLTEKVKDFYNDKIKKQNKKAADAIAQRINFEGDSESIVNDINDNMEDIEKAGGLEKWLDSLPADLKSKAKKAIRIMNGVDGLKTKAGQKEDEDGKTSPDYETNIIKAAIDNAKKGAKGADELKANLKELLNTDFIEKEVEKLTFLNNNEVEKLRLANKLKQRIKDLLDNEVEDMVKAQEQADKFERIAEEKQKYEVKEIKTDEDTGEDVKEVKKDEVKEVKPKEGVPDFTPNKEGDPDLVETYFRDDDAVAFNTKQNAPLEERNSKEYNRPQLSEYYLHSVNNTTYLDYINKHSDAIPILTNGWTPEQFKKYIEETHKYLQDEGAFTYVAYNLEVGDKLEFFIDETLDKDGKTLSDRAGTTIISIRTSNGQVIGTMPSQIDFDSISKIPVKNREGEFQGSYVEPEKKLTLAQNNPERYHLFQKIIEEYKKDKKEGKNSSSKVYFETLVEQLMGGSLSLANKESTVAEIFNGTGQEIMIGIVDDTSNIIVQGARDLPIHGGEYKSIGHTFVMIKNNRGEYIPARVIGQKLSSIVANKGKDDWYVQQIIAKLQDATKELNIVDSTYELDLYKLMRLPGMSVRFVYYDKASKKKVKDTSRNIDNATHLEINYDNDAGDHRTTQIKLNDDKQIDEDAAFKAITEIVNNSKETRINVLLSELKKKNHSDYVNNISNYLLTNLTVGNGAHTINDWFTYEYNTKSDTKTLKDETDREAKNSEKTPRTHGEEVVVDGKTYEIIGDDIRDYQGNLLSATEAQKVKEALKRQPSEISKKEKEQESPSKNIVEEVKDKIKKENEGNTSQTTSTTNQDKAEAKNEAQDVLASMSRKKKGKDSSGPKIQKFMETFEDEESREEEVSVLSEQDVKRQVEELKRLFPNLSEEGRIVIVKGLIRTVNENGDPITAYGAFIDGVIYLSDTQPKGVHYHESFHYIADMLLTQDEKNKMFREAQSRYNSTDTMYLEEKLAEDFRDYMNGMEEKSNSFIARVFRKLKQIINSLFHKEHYLDTMFYNIYSGRYSNRKENQPSKSSKFMQASYTQEMLDIKAKAIADGTFMKAPNGKPTNLTERQWLQVRTKAFKNWFGDWLKHDKENPYNTDVKIIGPFANYDGSDMKGIGAMFALDYKGETIGEIPINAYLRKNGIESWGEKEQGVISASSIGIDINLDTEYRGKGLGKAMYFAFAQKMADLGYTFASSVLGNTSEDAKRVWDSLVRDGYAYKKNDRYYFNNSSLTNASKIVDENGEPLVVYHGNPDKNITIFGSKDGRFHAAKATQFYFTANKAVAHSYTEEEENASFFVIKGFNAPEIYEDDYYDYLSYDEYRKSKDYQHGRIYEVFLNLRNPVEGINPQTPKDDILYFHPNADGFISYKVIDNYHGSVFNTDEENERFGDEQYVVFNPNQIKSATDNNGEFSRENDNIYYENESKRQEGTRDKVLEGILDKEHIGSVTIESIKDIREFLNSTVYKNSDYVHIAKLLENSSTKQGIKFLRGVKIKVVDSLYGFGSRNQFRNKRAYYDASNKTIYIDGRASYKNGDASSVIMHEIMHHITLEKLASSPTAKANLKRILEQYKKEKLTLRYFGEHELEEFVADIWTNPDTINDLKSIKTNNVSLWDKIKKFFQNVLGSLFRGAQGTLLQDASSELLDLLEVSPSVQVRDTYFENENTPTAFEKELLRYKDRKTDYENLDSETKEYLQQRKISVKEYQELSPEFREIVLQCM